MEKRALLATLLALVVLFLFQSYFAPKAPPAKPAPVPVTTPQQQVPLPSPPAATAPAVVPLGLPPADREFKIRVETRLYKAVFTNRGARLVSFKLKEYSDYEQKPFELICADAAGKDLLPFALDAQNAALTKQLNSTIFSVDKDTITLTDKGLARLTMEGRLPNGGWVLKTFEFYPYSYEIKVHVAASPDLQGLSVMLGPGLGNLSPDQSKSSRILRGSVVYQAAGKIQRRQDKTLTEIGPVDWLGVEDSYFVMLARFARPVGAAASGPYSELHDIRGAFIRDLPAQPFMVYLGPKDYTLLRHLGKGMDRIVDYGYFGIIAKPMLIGLQFLYKYVHNYGLAIIILTVAIKIVLFPLTWTSSISMLKTQRIQPEINAIRERYSKKKSIEDRQKMNQDIMKLYKERGINPLGGCVPMLIQVPFFFAFYRLLSVSIELRNAPFVWWIHDLSAHDPYYITPILMGVTQLVQQKMTPSPPDPVQAKMMMIMPVFMTFLFMNVQSGLVLYWTVNNVLTILQQYLMSRAGVVPARGGSKK